MPTEAKIFCDAIRRLRKAQKTLSQRTRAAVKRAGLWPPIHEQVMARIAIQEEFQAEIKALTKLAEAAQDQLLAATP